MYVGVCVRAYVCIYVHIVCMHVCVCAMLKSGDRDASEDLRYVYVCMYMYACMSAYMYVFVRCRRE